MKFRIGEKFVLTLDKRLKDVMLIGHDGQGVVDVYLLDLDTGMIAAGPVKFVKFNLGKEKNRFYLTEKQMSKLLENPKERLMSIGAGFPELVMNISFDGTATLTSTEALQLFLIDDLNNTKARMFLPAYPDEIRKVQREVEKYWDEGWE